MLPVACTASRLQKKYNSRVSCFTCSCFMFLEWAFLAQTLEWAACVNKPSHPPTHPPGPPPTQILKSPRVATDASDATARFCGAQGRTWDATPAPQNHSPQIRFCGPPNLEMASLGSVETRGDSRLRVALPSRSRICGSVGGLVERK